MFHKYTVCLVPLSLVATIGLGAQGDSKADPGEMMREARVAHARARDVARKILANMPDDLRAFSPAQIEAIKTCAVFRDEYPARDLLRVLLVEYYPPGHGARPGRIPFPDQPFTGYPAAWALSEIGWPAVLYICGDLEDPKLKIEPARLEMYGLIMGRILRKWSGPFVELRRSRAPKEVRSRYDDLLETQAIRYYRGIPPTPPGIRPK